MPQGSFSEIVHVKRTVNRHARTLQRADGGFTTPVATGEKFDSATVAVLTAAGRPSVKKVAVWCAAAHTTMNNGRIGVD